MSKRPYLYVFRVDANRNNGSAAHPVVGERFAGYVSARTHDDALSTAEREAGTSLYRARVTQVTRVAF